MTILQTIRNKAQQALTGIGNFIDRDKSMGGVQLAQGGLVNRVSSALNSAQQANQNASNWAINQPAKAVNSAVRDWAVQPAMRGITTLANTAERAIGAGNGVKTLEDMLAATGGNRAVQSYLYGDKPITSLQEITDRRSPDTASWLQKGGLSPNTAQTIAPPLTFLTAGALTAADAFPGDPTDLLNTGKNAAVQNASEAMKALDAAKDAGKVIVKEVTENADAAIPLVKAELPKILNVTDLNAPSVPTNTIPLKSGNKVLDVIDATDTSPNGVTVTQLLGGKTKYSYLNPSPDAAGAPIVKEVVEDAPKLNPIAKFQDSFKRWVNTREGFASWRGGDIKRNPVFTAFDGEGMAAIKELQAGLNPEKYADINRFTDELFAAEQKAGLIDPTKYRNNYLPQMWDNTPEEIQQVFAKTVGKDPGFTKSRLFQDYAAGIEAGLTPRYTTISDLLEARFKTATRALADKDFVNSLIETGNAVPLGDAPKGWISIPEVMKDGKPLAIPKALADKIGNYTSEGSSFLEKTARFVSETKQTLLSAGIPRTGINFHTGVNIPVRAMMARNPFSAVIDSTVWNWHPQAARDYVASVPKNIVDGLLQHGVTITRSAQDSGYGFKPEKGKGLIKGARTWMDKAFSEVAFDDILPAHKLKYGWEAYNKAIKAGSSDDEAFEIAAKTANEMFGGINVTEMARNKDFQNVLRTFFLAPDWLESNTRIALKTGSLLNPGNWGNKALAPYKRVALNAMAMYGTMAMTNKALSGHYPWENGAGQEFNLATGQFDERGREIMIPAFGTAFDAFRIPYTIISGIAQNDLQAITNVVKNRLSPIVGAGVALASNSDYRGREIVSPDKTPLQNILGVGGQAATAVGVPSQITNTAQFLAGNTTPLEYGAGMLEAPLRFRGGANTEAKRKQAETMKSAGLSNEEVASTLSYKPKSEGGLFGMFGGGAIGTPPTATATRKEKEDYTKSINEALDSGSIPDEKALAYSFFDNKSAASASIEERTKVYQSLDKVMKDEYYTDEQKQAVLAASGADPKDAEFYTLASKDQDVRLQELLPKLDNMDDADVMNFLMMGRRAVGGKQLVSNGMVDYLFENDYIGENEKDAIKALKYDEIKGDFYFSKSFKSGGKDKLTYKEALKLFDVELPKFSQMKGIDALLQSYSQGTTQTTSKDATLLDNILYKAPRKRTRFLT